MSNKPPIEKASNLISIFQNVTMEKFLHFLSINHIKELSCPLCKYSDELIVPTMRYPDSDENDHYFLTPVKVKSMDYDHDTLIANYSYRVICQRCGHEMHFSCAPVAFWDQNEKKGNRNDS